MSCLQCARTTRRHPSVTGDNPYFAFYLPTEGWYVFATRTFDAAVEGDLRSNQVQFRLEDQSYLLLTGAPIASALKKLRASFM